MKGREDNLFFDNLKVRHLAGRFNTCDPNWTEINVSYLFHKFYYFTGY